MATYDERVINNMKGFEASMKHFQKFSSVMRGCTDIDLAYERHGRFLFLEGKSVQENWTKLNVSWGQWFLFKQLRKAIGNQNCKIYYVAYTESGKYDFFPIGIGRKENKEIVFTKGQHDSISFESEKEMLDFVGSITKKMERRND
tara:strand:- start:2144 stop:2578 length:435 start_codon:yes stop_codon:yes gene_type:complete